MRWENRLIKEISNCENNDTWRNCKIAIPFELSQPGCRLNLTFAKFS